MSKSKGKASAVGADDHIRPQSRDDASAVGDTGDTGQAPEETAVDAVEQLAAEVAEWKDYARRAAAEFENTKKRLAAQQAMALEHASERVVAGLIPVMDDLEYGIAHATESEDTQLAANLEPVYAKLLAVMAAEGIEVLDPTGAPFDHNTANAVQMVEDATLPDQTVAQTLQKGYVRGARVIRPAMVVVATGGSAAVPMPAAD